MTTDSSTAMSIDVERVLAMSEREVYDLADQHVKGRYARYAIDPETRTILEQRDISPDDRDSRYDELFESFRQRMHNILFSPEVLPRYRLALQQTVRAVEQQLEEYSDNKSWKRGAMGFLSLVKDEMARADVVSAQHEEDSARHHLHTLLAAIAAHEEAEDADAADDQLYAISEQIRSRISPEDAQESRDLLSA